MDLPLVNTVPEDIHFLPTVGVEVAGLRHGWILHDAVAGFPLQLESNAELTGHGRYERDACPKLGVKHDGGGSQ